MGGRRRTFKRYLQPFSRYLVLKMLKIRLLTIQDLEEVTEVLPVKIGGLQHNIPAVWCNEVFHNLSVSHFSRQCSSQADPIPPDPKWPRILVQFYSFALTVPVLACDIDLQFKCREKVNHQYKAVSSYVVVYGGHVRDITVDIHFVHFLEEVELHQYLPSTQHASSNQQGGSFTVEDGMRSICGELEGIVRGRTDLEDGLAVLLLKYLQKSDLCTFILAVANSNSVPTDFESSVVTVLRDSLNLPHVKSLSDLTGMTLGDTPSKDPAPSTATPQQSNADIHRAITNLLPDDSKISEDVREYIVKEPMRVLDMIGELQKTGKPLTFDSLSVIIREKILTPPTGAAVPVPRVRAVIPPGYNPRYYSPHVGPQHQQRYGRPPLRRPVQPAMAHVAPIAPPTAMRMVRPLRFKEHPPNKRPPMIQINKAVQVMPAQRTVQQQVNFLPIAASTDKRKQKFVDLDFCPHV
eukprot:sb/3464457/